MHVGVGGYEKADRLVKEALEKGPVEMHISTSKSKLSIIKKKMFQLWQKKKKVGYTELAF